MRGASVNVKASLRIHVIYRLNTKKQRYAEWTPGKVYTVALIPEILNQFLTPVFNHLTFKHALTTQIQYLVDYVLSHCFWTSTMLSKF